MNLAVKLHKCMVEKCDIHKILDIYRQISDKDTLALVNEYFFEQYGSTPEEILSEQFQMDELYAISSTLKYIREPSKANLKSRNSFYARIGHTTPSAL
jgi:hypothetical protein